jgi:ADP-glucose pyrophosphorylase
VQRALASRTEWKTESVIVCNSDNLYSVRAVELLQDAHSPCALIDYDRDALGLSAERAKSFAVVLKRNGVLVDLIEKPTDAQFAAAADDAGRIGVSMNIYRLSRELILPYLERVPFNPERNEKELPTAVAMMLREHPGSVDAIPLAEPVPDMTSRDDLGGMQEYLRAHFPSMSWDAISHQ